MTKKELLDFIKNNPDRVYYFNEDISAKTGKEYLNFVFNKYKEDQQKEIVTIVSTFGGSVEEVTSIYDIILALNINTATVGTGIVASAGNVLLASGKYRFATKHTKFLIHQMFKKTAEGLTVDNMQAELKGFEITREFAYDIHRKTFSKIPKKILEGPAPTYFDVNDALKYGMIHDIL